MSGAYVCRFVVEAEYPGKRPFLVGVFTTPRRSTEQETEAAAMSAAQANLDCFAAASFPDGTPPPRAIRARLGAMTFIPDDYEWRASA